MGLPRIKVGGNWVTPSSVRVKRMGAWVTPSAMYKKISGVWTLIWEAYSIPVFVPDEYSAFGFGTEGGFAFVYTAPVEINLLGGSAPFTWEFTRVSGDTPTSIGEGSGNTGEFQIGVFGFTGEYSGVVKAKVTDGNGNIAEALCNWSITIGNNEI